MITAFLTTLIMMLAAVYVTVAGACYLTCWWILLFTDDAEGYTRAEKIQLATIFPAVLPILWVLQK